MTPHMLRPVALVLLLLGIMLAGCSQPPSHESGGFTVRIKNHYGDIGWLEFRHDEVGREGVAQGWEFGTGGGSIGFGCDDEWDDWWFQLTIKTEKDGDVVSFQRWNDMQCSRSYTVVIHEDASMTIGPWD